jgi:hypothetical protein
MMKQLKPQHLKVLRLVLMTIEQRLLMNRLQRLSLGLILKPSLLEQRQLNSNLMEQQ